jgi:hypothetical protein
MHIQAKQRALNALRAPKQAMEAAIKVGKKVQYRARALPLTTRTHCAHEI